MAEKTLTIEDFEYDLDPSLIAQKPLEQKADARLLVVDRLSGNLQHKHFYDLPSLLKAGDLIIVNDTKVLPSRLIAKRKSGGTVKLLLLKPQTYNIAIWEAMVTPIKRLKPGQELEVEDENGKITTITVKDIVLGPDGFKRLLIDLGAKENVYNLLSSVGFAPLPPYITRDYRADQSENGHRKEDLFQYQTVFAQSPGAVAAPTAGLHFTPPVIEALKVAGIEIATVTLHVGAGTFKPIEAEIEDHTIEEELYTVSEATTQAINKAKREGRRVIAVGTTSLRTLETAGASGTMKAADNQSTALYIKPGHKFAIADAMITNFHLSRSSLLVLVSAVAGRDLIMKAYQEAIAERYRFYSYGDAMLIL
ncbi:tRNA preQ1(34) S-adenosylmethionine ribosyltransferase-isomerase QueA [soil metagenome]